MAEGSVGRWALLVLVSCEGGAPHPPYSPQATSALTRVDVAPPPGRVEVIPKRPGGADAWVDGEWILLHGRWSWLLGRWVRMQPGLTYAPWTIVRAPNGALFYAPSLWVDARGRPAQAPAPMVFATASGEAVFDPEGNVEPTGRNVQTSPPTRTRPSAANGEIPGAQ